MNETISLLHSFQKKLEITPLKLSYLNNESVSIDLLRLDLMHPTLSGNKWFKLQYQLQQAIQQGKDTLLSFGGAYSNHLHAMAFTGKQTGFKTIGIIRGEQVQNATLQDCVNWGMELKFMPRSAYKFKHEIALLHEIQEANPQCFIIPEGGSNEEGVKGCEEILSYIKGEYSHVVCAVGTGTTMAGLIRSTTADTQVIGVSALKNALDLDENISQYTSKQNWSIIHDYHFGGFGKAPKSIIAFMKDFKQETGIELDRVYTSKMMFGLLDLIKSEKLQSPKKILAIHSGGLQGNRSLLV